MRSIVFLASIVFASLATVGTAAAASPAPSVIANQWAEDLAVLDAGVRTWHPGPFTINPEATWNAKLAELRQTLPTASPDEQIVQLAGLVGLLDTHSWFTFPANEYEMMAYPFADGWFVVVAKDPSLVGSRLVSINGTPITEVEAAMRPLIPADNESGELDGLQYPVSSVEYLHGLGIVDDPAKPGYLFQRPDGTQVTVDLGAAPLGEWEQELGIIGDLMGAAPEAVARRTEPIWTRADPATRTFLFSYNDYVAVGRMEAIAAMETALDDGSADHVVFDMRYLRGGNGGLAFPVIDALAGDARISGPGGLTVLIGRENVSAGTLVAAELDKRTQATFVGEMTPARADNFLCDCHDIALPNSGFTVTVPTYWADTGDTQDAIRPDIPMSLSAADFFAGRDPVLDAVLGGNLPSIAP
jgi:hypothetical protein